MYTLLGTNGKPFQSTTKGKFGGHRKLKIYGRLDCPSALRFIAKGQYVKHRVFFADEITAVESGYRPCGVCLPEAYKRWKNFGAWCRMVLKEEGLGDWAIKPGEAYCWIKNKTITFDFKRYAGNFQLFLHEVAHALHPEMEALCACRKPNHYHGGGWASTHGKLITKYMVPR